MELLNIRVIVTILLLIFGVILTVITIRRMTMGQISLPGWVKVLVCAAMIMSLLILVIGVIPPHEIGLDELFTVEQTQTVVPLEPSIGSEASQ